MIHDAMDESKDAMAIDLLPALREKLQQEANGVSDEHLLMFLRWKPNVDRAADRYRNFLKWKCDSRGLFDDTLRVTKDRELERLLATEVIVSVPDLLTKSGGPLLIGRLRNNDMTDGRSTKQTCRMLFYTIDRVMERTETHTHGVSVLHDLRGFDKDKNARLEVAMTVFRGIFGHFPLRVNAIYFWNAPPLFPTFFRVFSMLILTRKIRERIRFIDDLSEIEDIIDRDDLLTDIGGSREWNVRDWIDNCKQRETDGSFKTMTDIAPV